jgi:hypothetical protein
MKSLDSAMPEFFKKRTDMSTLDVKFKDVMVKEPQKLPQLPPMEDPSPEMTYALLAKELNKLSIKERDNILADIHGVGECIEEFPAFVQESLAQMEVEVTNIQQKSAYLAAEQDSPTYVKDEAFRLKFLRAHRFDVRSAADAMVGYFQSKLELFGPKKLTREIGLQDFDEDDMALLRRGGYQVLPQRDSCRRVVVAQWPQTQTENDTLRSKVREGN